MLQWISFTAVVFCLVFVNDTMNGYSITMVNILSVILRSSNIAAKYATLPKKLIKKYREQQMTLKELSAPQMISVWAKQTSDVIETEALNALTRNSFDIAMFKMCFLAKVSEKFQGEMKTMSEDVLSLRPWTTEVNLRSGKKKSYYSGIFIFGGMVKTFQKLDKNRLLFFRGIILSFVAGLAPIWSKLLVGQPLRNQNNVSDTVAFYFACIFSTLLFFFVSVFFNQARIDIKRTVFNMHQLSHLVSTQRQGKDIVKILPTINLLEELSLNSWKILRRVAVDYGKQYFFRHELYLPVVFLIGMVCMFGGFGLEYALANFNSLDPNNIRELQYCLFIISVVLLFMTFDLLWAFSSINEFFEIHTLKLHNVSAVLSDLKKYKPLYFSKYIPEAFKDPDSQGMLDAIDGSGQSHVHGKLALEISQMLGDRMARELDSFLDRSLKSVDSIINEIGIDQKYQSIEILGFTVSKNFTGNLLVLLLSGIFGVVQFLSPNLSA